VFPIYGASGGIAATFIYYFDTDFNCGRITPSGSYMTGGPAFG